MSEESRFEPTISVILPAFGSAWLDSAATVLAQTRPRWTLLLVGPEPDVLDPKILALIADRRVGGVRSESGIPSQGYSEEWGVGLAHSHADIVTFLEPGMAYEPTWFDTLAEVMYPSGQYEPTCEIVADMELRESPSRTAALGRLNFLLAAGLPHPSIRPSFAEWIERLTRLTSARTIFGPTQVRPLHGNLDPAQPESNDPDIRTYDGYWRPIPDPAGSPLALHA